MTLLRRAYFIISGIVCIFIACSCNNKSTSNVTNILKAGWSAYSAGDYEAAYDFSRKAISLDHNCADAYALQSYVYLNTERTSEAITAIDTAIRINPTDSLLYVSKAEIYYSLKRYDEVVSNCTLSIYYGYNKPDIYVLRAKAYGFTQDYISALNDFNTALDLAPTNSLNYALRAAAFFANDDLSSAHRDIQTSLSINPRESKAYQVRALLYEHEGKNELAIADYDRAIEFSDNSAALIENRSKVLNKISQEKKK